MLCCDDILIENNLKAMLIYDDAGIPLYMNKFYRTFNVDDMVISGLLMAITAIARKIFQQNIATLKFQGNQGDDIHKIVFIAQEMFKLNHQIYSRLYAQKLMTLSRPMK